MITPRFKLTQDDSYLIVTIHAPYTNLKETEVEYDEKTFLFSSKPYFLRLYLPREVTSDSDLAKTNYDTDSGTFTIYAPKKNPSEFFPNLDMLSELIKPQKISAGPLVVELPSSQDDEEDAVDFENEDSLFEQKLLDVDEKTDEESICHLYGYGFAWGCHGVVGKLIVEIGSLFDVPDPESIAIDARSDYCREIDEEKFDAEYYLADFFTPDSVQKEAMQFEFNPDAFEINDLDRELLKDLPIRYLGPLSDDANYQVALSLIDICFAYCYDWRTNTGEHTVESGWTIAKLSPTLSVLTRWQTAHEALISVVRRSLVYPVCRNWDLSMKITYDLEKLMTCGRTAILHCLLDIRKIFNTGGEFRYLLNQLYINDYCLWIQSVKQPILDKLAADLNDAIKRLKTDKFSLGLDLEFIEADANMKMLQLEANGESVVNLVEENESDNDKSERTNAQVDSDDEFE